MESLASSLLRSLRLGLYFARRDHTRRVRELELDARKLERLEELARRLADELERERDRRRLAQR